MSGCIMLTFLCGVAIEILAINLKASDVTDPNAVRIIHFELTL